MLITTIPFRIVDRSSFDLLKKARIDNLINPLNRKLTLYEVNEVIREYIYVEVAAKAREVVLNDDFKNESTVFIVHERMSVENFL